MADSKNHAMTDFLAAFFVGERVTLRILSEVVKNKNQPLYGKSLGFPEDFTLPVFQDDRSGSAGYALRQKPGAPYTASLLGEPCTDHLIASGDYISFSNTAAQRSVKVLFISTADLKMGYKKYRLLSNTNLFIGRTPVNEIAYSFTDYISREKHAAIRVDEQGNAFIEDLKRSAGVYVNGQLAHSRQLQVFDEVFLMGLSIVYMGDYIAIRDLKLESTLPPLDAVPAKTPLEPKLEKTYFVSSPRILKSLDSEEIEIDSPPNPSTADKTPAVLVIGPSLTMALAMLISMGISISNALQNGQLGTIITSGTMAVGMLLGAVMWPLLLRSYRKRRAQADEKYRKARYTAYISDIEKKLLSKRERLVRILNDSLYPAPKDLCALLDDESKKLRLWERSYEDADFLSVRLGLGSRPFDAKLKIPRQGFQLYEDEMRDLPTALAEKYSTLSNVPLTLDILNNRTIGIIGSQKNIQAILYEIILNVIALHAYDEVKLAIVATPKRAEEFRAFRNVPHIWSTDKRVRFFATNPEEVHFAFTMIDELIRDRENQRDESTPHLPHLVLIVTEPELVEKEALLRYMNDAGNRVGLTTIFAYGEITKLPKSCKTIIQSDEFRTGYYIKNKNARKSRLFWWTLKAEIWPAPLWPSPRLPLCPIWRLPFPTCPATSSTALWFPWRRRSKPASGFLTSPRRPWA